MSTFTELNIHAPEQMVCYKGKYFNVLIEPDDSWSRFPWNESDGHGSIRTTRNKEDKRAGEVILGRIGCAWYYYNLQAAQATALADGWGARAAAQGLSKRQMAAQAVLEDIEYCRKWVDGDIYYTYVSVVSECGYFEDALGGVECGVSYDGHLEQYVTDTVLEMCENVHLGLAEEEQANAQVTVGCIPLQVSDELSNQFRSM